MREVLPVCQLPAFLPDQETSVLAAFATCPTLALQQSWRPSLQAGFKPGQVRVGRREQALWALADLEDLEIFNRADGPNQKTWELGDVFEVFAMRQDEPGYIEVHVTPENHRLHLRFPDEQAIKQVRSGVKEHADYFEDTKAVVSHTWVHREVNVWLALLKLPLEVASGEVWRLSFCRYDATQGAEPVASSTSMHSVADFHRPSEWRLFVVP